MKNDKVSVLFVCLGNICRSPSAQSVFEAFVSQHSLSDCIEVDSCGTAAYHINEPPDTRSTQAAESRGYKMSHLRGRQLTRADFKKFHYVLAMDSENLKNIKDLKPGDSNCSVTLFLDFDKNSSVNEVPDPYYGGEQGFEQVLDLIEGASEHLLMYLKEQHSLNG